MTIEDFEEAIEEGKALRKEEKRKEENIQREIEYNIRSVHYDIESFIAKGKEYEPLVRPNQPGIYVQISSEVANWSLLPEEARDFLQWSNTEHVQEILIHAFEGKDGKNVLIVSHLSGMTDQEMQSLRIETIVPPLHMNGVQIICAAELGKGSKMDIARLESRLSGKLEDPGYRASLGVALTVFAHDCGIKAIKNPPFVQRSH